MRGRCPLNTLCDTHGDKLHMSPWPVTWLLIQGLPVHSLAFSSAQVFVTKQGTYAVSMSLVKLFILKYLYLEV